MNFDDELFKIRHFYPEAGLIIDIFGRKHTDLEQDFHTKSPKMIKKMRKVWHTISKSLIELDNRHDNRNEI